MAKIISDKSKSQKAPEPLEEAPLKGVHTPAAGRAMDTRSVEDIAAKIDKSLTTSRLPSGFSSLKALKSSAPQN